MNAEQYLGIKWLAGGRDANSGLDCWGLLRYIYANEYRLFIPRYAANPGALASAQIVEDAETTNGQWKEVDRPIEGDVVALGNIKGFSHVGVYVEIPEASLIHITAQKSSVIASLVTLGRQGLNRQKFYRHVDRYIH